MPLPDFFSPLMFSPRGRNVAKRKRKGLRLVVPTAIMTAVQNSPLHEWTNLGGYPIPPVSPHSATSPRCYEFLRGRRITSPIMDVPPELLSMSGELRRTLYASSGTSLDLEAFIPELRGTTEILTEEHRKQLSRHLPARAEGYTWHLVFSTSQHGFSLNSLYRKMNNVQSPILMVIEDTSGNVFGALTSCALQISDHFYGTGESFLYRFAPEIKIYKWTGENTYHIKGDYEALCIGAGDGKFGLWLDGDLNVGRSESCSTYNNEPLSSNLNFTIKTLECWAFM